jgi:peptide/nickel transport system substrate-binding protein
MFPFRCAPVVLLILTVVLQPSQSLSENQGEKQSGDTLIIGDFAKPSPINPILTRGTISALLKDIIFDGLTKEGEYSNVQPHIALSWRNSADGLLWQFHLREGITFHDGTELTAEDVKFTLDTILDPRNNSPYLNLLKCIDNVETNGRYRVDITLSYPNVSLLSYLTVGILPKHLLEGRDLTRDEFNFRPIGTGPFKLKKWSELEIELEANERYFLAKPHLEKIIARIFPSQSIVWANLMKKELDLILLATPRDYRIIERIPDLKVHSYLSFYSHLLAFNNSRDLFECSRIRQALNYCVDKERLLEKVLLGKGLMSSGTIFPRSWAFDPHLQPYPYDPKKALELLRSEGWEDTDGNHTLDRKGKEFEFVLLILEGDDVSRKSGLHIQQQFMDIGINMKIQPSSFSEYEASLLTRKFDATLLNIISDDPDKNSLWWHSSQIDRGLNVFSYRNKKVDELLDKGRVTLDREKRRWIYHQFQRQIYGDPPGIFLFWRDYLIGIHKRFRGIRFSTAGILNNITEWYVPKEEQKYR